MFLHVLGLRVSELLWSESEYATCFLQAVVNMMIAVEAMLSPDTATTDDIEKMTKTAMDAWKEFKNKSELAKGSADSTA